MAKIILYGYKRNSKSLRALETTFTNMGCKAVRRSKKTIYLPKIDDTIVVWGANHNPNWKNGTYINTPQKVSLATNKLHAFNLLHEKNISIPEYTTDLETAKLWIKDCWIVCRTLLRASGGRGIVLAKTQGELVKAPLYVKYKRKDKEFRVHIFKDKVIDVAEKKRRQLENRPENYNPYIRNYEYGWVYCRDNVTLPEDVKLLAVNAVTALQLDFGAVDIIYNSKHNKAYVLEINTAPGLQGQTLINYAKAILD